MFIDRDKKVIKMGELGDRGRCSCTRPQGSAIFGNRGKFCAKNSGGDKLLENVYGLWFHFQDDQVGQVGVEVSTLMLEQLT